MTAPSQRKQEKEQSAIMVDSSPVEIEPNEDYDDGDESEKDANEDESSSKNSTSIASFIIPVVGFLLWLITVLSVIINLLSRPLTMIGCLVGVNVFFPVLFFLVWFRRQKKSQTYEMLLQDEDEPRIEPSIAMV